MKPSGTSAHSKTLQKGDYVAHLSNVYYGLIVSEVMDARCDRDSAGREFPNITLHSGHVLKSDDWIRKLDARFTNDHKWDSKSGTPHQVYEFIWCCGESADTGMQELQNRRRQIMSQFVLFSSKPRRNTRSTKHKSKTKNKGINLKLAGDIRYVYRSLFYLALTRYSMTIQNFI